MTAVNPPLQSMTGFAAADGSLGEATWTWSLKSVNGKSLDIRWRMPSRMDGLEQSLRKTLQAEVTRGSIAASLQLDLPSTKQDVQVNQELFERLSAFARDNGDGMVAANPAEIMRLPEQAGRGSDWTPASTEDEDHGSYDDSTEVEERLSLVDSERELIRRALVKHGNRRKQAADELGISERTLYRKIKEFGLK